LTRADRGFAQYVAVNVDGSKFKNISKHSKTWRKDDRIDLDIQRDNVLYKARKPDPEPFDFQKGHLVRRVLPGWGTNTVAKRAVEDTYHYTNAAPQERHYNNVLWGNLEDYLLEIADKSEKKLTVFSGPVFRGNDPLYGYDREGGPFQIPMEFWKVAVLQRTKTRISAAAFMIGQRSALPDEFGSERKFGPGLSPYTVDELIENQIQIPISEIEAQTELKFGSLKNYDKLEGLESTKRVRSIRTKHDILI